MKPVRLSRAQLASAALALVLVAPLVAAGAYAYNRHVWAAGKLAEIEPRYARLAGLEASKAELDQATNAAQAQLARLVWPSSRDASQTGLEAQQKVRRVATGAGLTIQSSQVLPAKEEGPFERIPIVVQAEGELGSVQAALAVLANEAPLVHFDSVALHAIGPVKAEAPQRLNVRLQMFVLRSKT